ncbi:MAG: DNA mismatch repair endonuclease MutL [Prevotellaceae bacterium]|jgi:DNA mismatch repair protein MutL|nr:DNA mismatch repair endonuclease MutL [Prevotellaceae bacterium]
MIRILPEYIANRIAAGEVVQRPASAVKELLENAVDAGATTISLIVEDAGRTLIQVVDNGSGMSPQEASIAFERHATSKIINAEDLETIQTFGFRGEALAAIAAVSQVTLRTRQEDEETGIQIEIQGSKHINESPISCPVGANFEIRNLFYNIPARRKFLKSEASEFKHILAEFTHISLCRCDIEFKLIHNGQELYHLLPAKLFQRLTRLLGKEMNQELVPIEANSSLVQISGYVGKPQDARKSAGNQLFFINGRFFKSAYFQRAVLNAYEHLIPEKSWPSWCIFLEVDSDEVDVNIHPAKTEVKIDNEQMIFQILQAAVREALGKNALGPSIDFDMEGVPTIPPLQKGLFVPPPKIDFDPLFNPFSSHSHRPVLFDSESEIFTSPQPPIQPQVFQLKESYLLTPVKSGLMVIHIQRARQRILFDHYLNLIVQNGQANQQTLFPQEHTLNPATVLLLAEVRDELLLMGFDIRPNGKDCVTVYGLPVGYSTENEDVALMIDNFVDQLSQHTSQLRNQTAHTVALSIAIAECHARTQKFTPHEATQFIDKLFASSQPAISPLGKTALHIITLEDFDKMLS